jgi:hypothetical protein
MLVADGWADSWRIHGGFMADSWRIHGGFMADSWRIHGGFININDMYNNDVGKGVVYAYEAYEAK